MYVFPVGVGDKDKGGFPGRGIGRGGFIVCACIVCFAFTFKIFGNRGDRDSVASPIGVLARFVCDKPFHVVGDDDTHGECVVRCPADVNAREWVLV